MNINNTAINTMYVIKHLKQSDLSCATLEEITTSSTRQVKRYIQNARDLGADIVSIKDGKYWMYHLNNKKELSSGPFEQWFKTVDQYARGIILTDPKNH